jgi:hypothetical protein
MTITRPLIQIYNTEAGQVTVREMNDAEYSAWLSEQDAAQAAFVRAERSKLLAETDWRVLRALEDGHGLDFDLAVYRQALRDVPEQPGFPYNIVWPGLPQ